MSPEEKAEGRVTLVKARKQLAKDFVLYPALSGRAWKSTLAANATANLLRNLWSHSVIMCGHFPEGVSTFEQVSLDENETRGQWYLRQMLGSANISGSKLTHVMSGNLSHQIEHHLFPDLPSNRYSEVAPKVRALFDKYELNYHSAPLPKQVYSAWHKIVRLSLPNDWLSKTTLRNLPSQLRLLAKMSTADRAERNRLQAELSEDAELLAA